MKTQKVGLWVKEVIVLMALRKVVFTLFLLSIASLALGLEKGDFFPDLSLKNEVSTSYEDFSINKIETPVLVVQIFNMYCPHCQKDAPVANKLFERLVKDFGLKKVSMLGLGIGNTRREVEVFKNSFKIKFPLFWDMDNEFLKRFGHLGTPYFFVLKKTKQGFKIVYTKAGELQKIEGIYEQVKKALP